MKIMYVMDQLRLHGGVEKMLAGKINAWIQQYGYEVFLVTSEQKGEKFVYPVDSRVRHYDLGINYHRDRSYFSGKNLVKTARHIQKLSEFIGKLRPDVIISPSFTPDQYILPYLHKRIPKIKEVHFSGHILQTQTGPSSPRKLMERFFPFYDAVVVLNKDEEKYYPNFKTRIIPNFITLDSRANSFIDEQRDKIVIAAGRIAPVKQFDHLIKAWSLIQNRFPDWKIKIFGNGDAALEQKLKKLAQELAVQQTVLFPGAVSDMPTEMRKASVYAMTSETECFPMVLLEAKAAALPIVSYDCPNGPRNIVHDYEDGFLVDNQNIHKFAGALESLMLDRELRSIMSQNALQNAAEFETEAVMQKWDEALKLLVREKDNSGRSLPL